MAEDQNKNITEEIGELVKRALVQAGDLQAIQDRLRAIVEKTSKIAALQEEE